MLISSVLLFYLGMAFAYFLVFPIIFGFFASAAPVGVLVMTDVIELPGLRIDALSGVWRGLRGAGDRGVCWCCWALWISRRLRKGRPYVIVGAFVIGMVLTPPDMFSQTLLAVPIWLLFEAGLLVASLLSRRAARRDAASTVE